jgi:phosphomethylpyrimidine synthase
MPDSAPLSPTSLTREGEALRVTTGAFPASRKIRVEGTRHPELQVAMREIDLAAACGEPPLRVYDTSGPYSDPAQAIDIDKGLPELRKPWVLARGDVEFYEGRDVKPEDNGLKRGETSPMSVFDRARRPVLRGKAGAAVTQLAYARRGIVTPEMEYVAIRENLGRAAPGRGSATAANPLAPRSPSR